MTVREWAAYFADREFFPNPDQPVRLVLDSGVDLLDGIPVEALEAEVTGGVVHDVVPGEQDVVGVEVAAV